jgi:2-C-methyl-D-erythritol 4-phosphate cytidylyltransferase/2-C-methyl-D-erythritol 2,4-cyclodiphosphate synthase
MMDRPETEGSDTAVLIVAAGRGSRLGGLAKQYRAVGGQPILARTIATFAQALPGADICAVIAAGDEPLYEASVQSLLPDMRDRLRPPVIGGEQRQDSVRHGLESFEKSGRKIVLIHDAARPFASDALIRAARDAAHTSGAAVPGVAVTDTLKSVDSNGTIVVTHERTSLRAIQTPQAFRFDLILAAHRKAVGKTFTDDGAVAEFAGHPVHVFAGEPGNMKITTQDDLDAAEARLAGPLSDTRVGQGYDVHAFGPGDKVWFGGVPIPHGRGLEGHSDADVVAHAVTDALLGALADGDIGSHFPPSDPKWKGAASSIFLAYAAQRVTARGGLIANVDATIVCEEPKVGPFRDAIRESLAKIMGIATSRVAVKATTSERLGFTGRREGIAAMATATVRLPASS